MKDEYPSLKRWTRKVDIFKFDLVLVPINLDNMHWCIAVVDKRDSSITYYDSLGNDNNEFMNAMEKFIHADYIYRKTEILPPQTFSKS